MRDVDGRHVDAFDIVHQVKHQAFSQRAVGSAQQLVEQRPVAARRANARARDNALPHSPMAEISRASRPSSSTRANISGYSPSVSPAQPTAYVTKPTFAFDRGKGKVLKTSCRSRARGAALPSDPGA